MEFRNHTTKPVRITVCRSKLTGNIYVHIGEISHGKGVKVLPHDYANPEINEVDF